jgi:hypothetical protein
MKTSERLEELLKSNHQGTEGFNELVILNIELARKVEQLEKILFQTAELTKSINQALLQARASKIIRVN